MKYISLLILTFLSYFTANSLPAKRGELMAGQPDGSSVPVIMYGNAENKSIFSPEGYLLTTDSLGFYVYADSDSKGNPIAGRIRYTGNDNSLAGKNKELLNLNKAGLTVSYPKKDELLTRGPGLAPTRFPSSGQHRSIVILVEFPDLQFSIPNPKDYYTRMLNEPGFSENGGTGSARDYYLINSGGIFDVTFDVYGPVMVSKEYSEYGRNDYWGSDRDPFSMIVEACDIIDQQVDFKEYDRNNDNIIDNVYVFYAGYGEADGGGANTIWPHSADISQVYARPVFYDGVRLDHYACSNELQKIYEDLPDGIGTFCHEFGHVIGLPDLYSTVYNGAFTPGTWDLMDHGSYNNKSRTPPNLSSFERYALDWIKPEKMAEGEYFLENLGDSNRALLVYTKSQKEYFLFENRQKKGFDEYLPGHGMLVWHIDYDAKKWNENTVNNTTSHQNVDLVEADYVRNMQTYAGDPFPGSNYVTEFSSNTFPAFKAWNGDGMQYRIYDIDESLDGIINFKVENSEEAAIDYIFDEGESISIIGNSLYSTGRGEIYDLTGRKLGIINNETITLPAGIYIFKGSQGSLKFAIK